MPNFDEDEQSFDDCDHFNFCLHMKTWPLRSGSGADIGFDCAALDYLFTCTLVNAHHAFFASSCTPTKNICFLYFCCGIAIELILFAQDDPKCCLV